MKSDSSYEQFQSIYVWRKYARSKTDELNRKHIFQLLAHQTEWAENIKATILRRRCRATHTNIHTYIICCHTVYTAHLGAQAECCVCILNLSDFQFNFADKHAKVSSFGLNHFWPSIYRFVHVMKHTKQQKSLLFRNVFHPISNWMQTNNANEKLKSMRENMSKQRIQFDVSKSVSLFAAVNRASFLAVRTVHQITRTTAKHKNSLIKSLFCSKIIGDGVKGAVVYTRTAMHRTTDRKMCIFQQRHFVLYVWNSIERQWEKSVSKLLCAK